MLRVYLSLINNPTHQPLNILSYGRMARLMAACTAFATLAFIASCKKDEDDTNTSPDTDQENEAFTSVMIGSQRWMSENLSVASYSDGTPIPQITDPTEWANLTTGAWCWYNNDSATYAAAYGRLYNWYAVVGIYDAASQANPALRKQLAPQGWHVPSDSEWSIMINFLDPTADGGNNFNIAGGKMKTTGTIEAATGLWHSPNTEATNSSGFSAAPGGFRVFNGAFYGIGEFGYWWSSSEVDAISAWYRDLSFGHGYVYRDSYSKREGFSVRCLRD